MTKKELQSNYDKALKTLRFVAQMRPTLDDIKDYPQTRWNMIHLTQRRAQDVYKELTS